MKRLFIIPIAWLALASSAYGLSVEIPISPVHLDEGAYVFSVYTNAPTNGVAFHVTIAAKKGDIASDSGIGLCVVTHWPGGSQIVPADPAIPIALRTNGRIWKAEFSVSREQLKQAGLCCVFTEQEHQMANGKTIPASSATFYEIRLQEFLKP